MVAAVLTVLAGIASGAVVVTGLGAGLRRRVALLGIQRGCVEQTFSRAGSTHPPTRACLPACLMLFLPLPLLVNLQVSPQVGLQVNLQVSPQVGMQVSPQVGLQVGLQVCPQVGLHAGPQVCLQVGPQVGASLSPRRPARVTCASHE